MSCLCCGTAIPKSKTPPSWLKRGRGKFCSKKCYGEFLSGGNFDSHIQKNGGDSCWIWMGSLGTNGYGQFGGKRAHRIAYETANGPLPAGLYVCHRCDNPRCVRPEHLFLGTQRDNIHDAMRKGRMAFQGRPLAHTI